MCLILFTTPKSHLTCPVMDNGQADPKPSRDLPDWGTLNTNSFPPSGQKKKIKGVVGKDSATHGTYSLYVPCPSRRGERPGKHFIAQQPMKGITQRSVQHRHYRKTQTTKGGSGLLYVVLTLLCGLL